MKNLFWEFKLNLAPWKKGSEKRAMTTRLIRHFSKTSSVHLPFAFVADKLNIRKNTQTNWQQAVQQAETLVQTGGSIINPKELLGGDLKLLTKNIRKLLGSGHPVLDTISNYYFSQKGKHIRPLIVLLMAQATAALGKPKSPIMIDVPLNEQDPVPFQSANSDEYKVLPSQRRLAEITEMIHTASLLHDDVIDVSMTRRNAPTANAEFGNKMAILAGDFLLARASIALARLRHVEVVELMSTIISNLVEGEFMQLRNSALEGTEHHWGKTKWLPKEAVITADRHRFEYYMQKTYMKTASLIANSCQSSTVLGGCDTLVNAAAYSYGRNIGLAFQV